MASLYLNQVPPNPAWLSPALSVRKSAGLNQGGSSPILDVDPDPPSTEFQFLRAIAGNDTGGTFAGVQVQLWALAFATATASSLYLTSMDSTAGALVPAGGAMPINIGSNQEQPFERAWNKNHDLTSTSTEITTHFSAADEVHCCIYANVYHANDATSAAVPDQPSGPGPQLDVAGNRHHAQRNMTIKKKVPGDSLAFQMYAANPDFEHDQDVVLQIDERPPRKLQEWELTELAALGPWIRRRTGEPFEERGAIPDLEIVLDHGKVVPVRVADEPLKDLEMDVPEAGADRTLKFGMGADEARRMRLNATLPGDEFVLRILDVTQTQGDRTVGGARVMLMTVPEDLLRPSRELG